MLTMFQAVILGVVEGVTEFLPISSTFHLIWTSNALLIPQSQYQKLFEIVIQVGAIAAVAVVYAKEIIANPKLIKHMLAAFIPTAGIGFVAYGTIKELFFDNTVLQLAVFILGGLVFIWLEKSPRTARLDRDMSSLSLKEAVMVGLVQAASIIPGVSRAGAVLVALLFLKLRRQEAAKFSFLVALPTIAGAAVLDIYKSRHLLSSADVDVSLLIIGLIAAFISALIVVRFLTKYLEHRTLIVFGYYRLIVGAILLAITLQLI